MTSSILSLHGRLGRLGVDAILLNSSEVLPSINLRYLTGFTGSDASVLITATDRHIFTDGRYKSQVREQTCGLRIHVVRRKLNSLARTVKDARVRRLGIESSRVSHDFVTALKKRLPDVEIVDIARTFLERLRIRKTHEEKEKIAEAARIASLSCKQLIASRLVGRKEGNVADELETRFRRNGAQGWAFETIVASGERSALPHGTATDKIIQRGELVIIDYGCRFDSYNSDETVTCIAGKASREQRKIHQVVYDSHWRAIDCLKPGVKTREVDAVARRSIEKAGYGKYFLHGLGHGVGMEVHEPPYLSSLGRGVIEEGMVFTIEPGVYVEGLGGVRLESLVYMNEQRPQILSEMPKDLIVID